MLIVMQGLNELTAELWKGLSMRFAALYHKSSQYAPTRDWRRCSVKALETGGAVTKNWRGTT